jgi:hypothetical protein
MDDIKKIDYIIRVNTTEKNHGLVERLTRQLVGVLKLNETEIEYFKQWYMEKE